MVDEFVSQELVMSATSKEDEIPNCRSHAFGCGPITKGMVAEMETEMRTKTKTMSTKSYL
ncbi:uncharacterized protein STEHIDRAFT_122212 [Stereum hirsutum FP-91666 SS1]|uniref:uncharacterized protein n=1 Tax=Stereum hirsutum (strain FP-91666) TaxID=721885 RepID=UPI0004449B5B|nr:uncharacterized protein STEHIDRAFT_122212 [Stereum hirsutum FP-91666 SS1]EIM86290.1 hypothetical protein STEHIDRAFT_122212 [Stereum hirsutum FP-91666 SS1]